MNSITVEPLFLVQSQDCGLFTEGWIVNRTNKEELLYFENHLNNLPLKRFVKYRNDKKSVHTNTSENIQKITFKHYSLFNFGGDVYSKTLKCMIKRRYRNVELWLLNMYLKKLIF